MAPGRSVQVYKHKVVVSKEHYLPVELDDLVGALQNRLVSSGDTAHSGMLKDFVKLVEGLYRFNFNQLQRVLLNDFRPFGCGALGRKLLTTPEVAQDIHESLEEMETSFVESLVKLLQAAHFQLLTAEEYECALAEEFQLTLPMTVKTSQMDPSLLAKYWAAHPEERAQSPELADHCMVFHRGIKNEVLVNSDVNARVQQIVKYLIFYPMVRFVVAFLGMLFKITKVKIVKKVLDAVVNSAPMRAAQQQFEKEPEDAAKPVPDGAQQFERLPFRRVFPTTWSLIKGILAKKELREPSFRDIVVVYRAIREIQEGEKKELTPLEQELRTRNIMLKRFADVPMADIEIVFPEHKIRLQPVTILSLAAQCIGGLLAAYAMVAHKTDINAQLVLSVLALVGGKIGAAIGQANAERSDLERQINKMVYDKTLASQEAVLFLTMDEMLQQYTKQAVLLYFTLLAAGRPMTMEEVQRDTENLLMVSFKISTSLDVEQVVPQLVQDGIVVKSGDVLTCVPLEQGLTLLDTKWDQLFKYAEDDGASDGVGVPAGQGHGQAAFGLLSIFKEKAKPLTTTGEKDSPASGLRQRLATVGTS